MKDSAGQELTHWVRVGITEDRLLTVLSIWEGQDKLLAYVTLAPENARYVLTDLENHIKIVEESREQAAMAIRKATKKRTNRRTKRGNT